LLIAAEGVATTAAITIKIITSKTTITAALSVINTFVLVFLHPITLLLFQTNYNNNIISNNKVIVENTVVNKVNYCIFIYLFIYLFINYLIEFLILLSYHNMRNIKNKMSIPKTSGSYVLSFSFIDTFVCFILIHIITKNARCGVCTYPMTGQYNNCFLAKIID
jgi:hypothetical protein